MSQKRTIDEDVDQTEPADRKRKALDEVVILRDPILPKPLSESTSACKIISWNVAGLRGTLKNNPDIFDQLVKDHGPDVICLQETKLQSSHVPDFIDLIPGYTSYWSCSELKKGYSGASIYRPGRILKLLKWYHIGTAVFIKGNNSLEKKVDVVVEKKSKQATLGDTSLDLDKTLDSPSLTIEICA
jgi:hypothetical protein